MEINSDWAEMYGELIKVCREEHGLVKCDYCDSDWHLNVDGCGAKGLHRHHIQECFYPGLCDLKNPRTRQYGLEVQKKENLVYCTLEEHMMLHTLIFLARGGDKQYAGGVQALKILLEKRWEETLDDCRIED